MNEAFPIDSSGSKPTRDRDPPDLDWLQLKLLLTGNEQKRLARVEERLDNSETRAGEIGELLPRAIALGVERNSLAMTEAILAVIGPAIRNAISAALQEMLRNLDRLLENSLSPVAWKWRLEALRTGKPFSEVVLLHSLDYRVEQVFLIHRRTSLVIRHIQAPSALGKDPDVVSAMLSAIQDFVHHSFDTDRRSDLGAIQAGDLTIWIEQGPLAFLAAAIRGSPPLELRAQFRTALDQIHSRYYDELQKFQGDATPFESSLDLLERCLVFRFRPHAEKRKPVFAHAFCALVTALLLAAVLFLVRDTLRWKKYVAELRGQPGIVVTDSGGVWKHSIAGLRDPLSADPAQILGRSAVDPNKVTADWRPFVSTAPEVVLRRARQRLKPPSGVALDYDGSALRASGMASRSWMEDAGKRAMAIPGVERFEGGRLEYAELSHFQKQKRAVEGIMFLFAKGGTDLDASSRDAALGALKAVEELVKAADPAGKAIVIQVIGHADEDGPEQANLATSTARARSVMTFLQSHGPLKPDLFQAFGAGHARPLRKESIEADKAFNRSVTFEVTEKDRAASQSSKP